MPCRKEHRGSKKVGGRRAREEVDGLESSEIDSMSSSVKKLQRCSSQPLNPFSIFISLCLSTYGNRIRNVMSRSDGYSALSFPLHEFSHLHNTESTGSGDRRYLDL